MKINIDLEINDEILEAIPYDSLTDKEKSIMVTTAFYAMIADHDSMPGKIKLLAIEELLKIANLISSKG